MLRGKRVTLRSIERDDLKRLHELSQNVDEIMQAAGSWEPEPLAAAEKDYDRHLDDQEKSGFVIEADGKVIGTIHLHQWRSRRAGTGSFGVSILDREYLSKGYGREAIQLFLDWVFRIENYRRVWLMTLASNPRAVKCYEACGFQHEGRLRAHEYYNGVYDDVLVMGLLRDEWETRQREQSGQ